MNWFLNTVAGLQAFWHMVLKTGLSSGLYVMLNSRYFFFAEPVSGNNPEGSASGIKRPAGMWYGHFQWQDSFSATEAVHISQNHRYQADCLRP